MLFRSVAMQITLQSSSTAASISCGVRSGSSAPNAGVEPEGFKRAETRLSHQQWDSSALRLALVSSSLVTTSFASIVSQPSIRPQTIANELSLSTTPLSAFIIHGGLQAPHHRAGPCQFCQRNGRRRTLSLARAQNLSALLDRKSVV